MPKCKIICYFCSPWKSRKEKFFLYQLIALLRLSVFLLRAKGARSLKGVKNIVVDLSAEETHFEGDVYFFNPNKLKMKLKDVSVDILVDGTNRLRLNSIWIFPFLHNLIFPCPLRQSHLKGRWTSQYRFWMLGGKKYEVVFTGYIRVGVRGISIKVLFHKSRK